MMMMELTELMGFIENPYTALILSSAKRKSRCDKPKIVGNCGENDLSLADPDI
jgi:hypothetical protein